jgi:signal transduction histidine kinase
MLRRPVVVIWVLALITTAVSLVNLPASPLSYEALSGAGVIALLLVLGDLASVQLEDGSALTPASALLIAGLVVAGWPLLPLAALVGTLVSAAIRRRAPELALTDAGSRCLVVALSWPIFLLTEPIGSLPYSTPLALLGLALMGLVTYTVKLVSAAAAAPDRGGLPSRWRARGSAMRWYVLAMIPLGGLLGALWAVSPWALVLGLAPLVVAQHSFRNEVVLRRTTADFAQLAVQRETLATRLERLQSLATAMIGTLDVQAMLDILCVRLAALLDASSGWVVLLDEAGLPQLMTAHNVSNQAPLKLAEPQAYTTLLERGRVILVTDERCEALAPIAVPGQTTRWSAVLTIPMLADGAGARHDAPLGAICLAFDRLRGLDADEQRVLTSFARQAAVSVENARLFDELRRKQNELIQSSKLAAVGTFAAGIAHEFNNLLGSMLGYAELGYGINDLEEKNHSLDVVIQACRRGRSITRGLLTFARRQEHQRAMANLADAIDETLTLVEIDLRKSHIEIVRHVEPVPPTICDLGQLSQVVLNLITNARDAMKPHGGTLTVSLSERWNPDRQHGDWLELSVADTGSGIPEEIRDKIFEPFVTTKGALGGSQTPGTGLGLSVSYGIVQEHGGTITVDSTVGRGTTMTVRLPIIGADVEQEVVLGQY